MYRNVLKDRVRSSSNVLLGFAVAAAIALGGQQASAQQDIFFTANCDASIPYGTTTIHLDGFVNNNLSATLTVTLTNSDGTILLGPIDLAGQASANYSGTITVQAGCGPFTNTVTATAEGVYVTSATRVTTVSPALSLTANCDASIPFGTTTIHVSGTVTNIDPCATARGVTLTESDGTILLGPIDLAGGAGTNYSGTIPVQAGCGPFTNTVTATGDGLAANASATGVTTVTVYPTDITVCNDQGACGAFVTYAPCSPTCTPPSGSFFPLGTNTVTYGPADAPEGTFTVTVNACDNRCPLGPGFWKSQPSLWPVNSLTLGNITYTEKQLLAILKTPIGAGKMADASLILADQLIAAKLDLLNGSPKCPIASTVEAADSLIGNLPSKISPSSYEGQQMIALAATLANYNNGLLTPGCTP
jgi:hypothetical protein